MTKAQSIISTTVFEHMTTIVLAGFAWRREARQKRAQPVAYLLKSNFRHIHRERALYEPMELGF